MTSSMRRDDNLDPLARRDRGHHVSHFRRSSVVMGVAAAAGAAAVAGGTGAGGRAAGSPGVLRAVRAVLGRPSRPVECYLRLMFLKYRYRLGFETLCAEVSDSISWRRFCRTPLGGTAPHPTTLTTRCGSAAVDGLNEALLAKAAGQKLLRAARVRADTTVIPADVAYPADSGLLARAVRRIAATGRRIQAERAAAEARPLLDCAGRCAAPTRRRRLGPRQGSPTPPPGGRDWAGCVARSATWRSCWRSPARSPRRRGDDSRGRCRTGRPGGSA